MKKHKLAVLTSHQIQYQAPFFKKLAERSEIDLTVYFCWDFGVKKESYDAEFGKKLKWDIPLSGGYNYKFLKNYSLKPSSEFWGQVNFGIIKEIYDLRFKKSEYSDVPIRQGIRMLVFGWNSFTNWLAFLTAFVLKIPVLLRGENPLNQELSKPEWKIKIKKIILGWLFRRVSVFLYIGEENKKFYRFYGVPDKKLFFMPYAVDNERFIKAARELRNKKQELRNKLGIKEGDAAILFVGKLINKKRPLDILKAYQLLVASHQLPVIIHLLFVGDGALRLELEKYAKENNIKNVHFVGFKNQTELPSYYTIADIFVLPSEAGETWGLAVNEAMCFGLPVIVSSLVGCGPDLVKHGENGYIYPVADIDKLAESLMNLISSFYSDGIRRIRTHSDYGSQKRKSFEKSFEILRNYNYEKDIDGILKALNQ